MRSLQPWMILCRHSTTNKRLTLISGEALVHSDEQIYGRVIKRAAIHSEAYGNNIQIQYTIPPKLPFTNGTVRATPDGISVIDLNQLAAPKWDRRAD